MRSNARAIKKALALIQATIQTEDVAEGETEDLVMDPEGEHFLDLDLAALRRQRHAQ